MELIELAKTISPVIAALVTGLFVWSSHRHQNIKKDLLEAYRNIQFLQAVENVHVEMNIGRENIDNKRKVRKIVRDDYGYEHSGITPAAVNRKIESF